MTFNKLTFALLLSASLMPAFSDAALLGLSPSEPTVDFGGSGIIDYNASTGVVLVSGTPATLFQSSPFLFGEILGTGLDDERVITLQFTVDSAGHLMSSGVEPDLVIKGSIDTNFDGVVDYDGVLLSAEVTQFGFENGAGAAGDLFDLRLGIVSGSLAPLYLGKDLAIRVDSEVSAEFLNPFNGSFINSFTAQAAGVAGAIEPMSVAACQLVISASCSVDGKPDKSKCRIKSTKSPKHWEHQDYSYNGELHRRSTYGMHGNAIPLWSRKYASTDVRFTYVITNIGLTPVSNLVVTDSFDTPVVGVPASLAPGQSATLLRTETLNEGLDVNVTVMGEYQTSACGDTDVVSIKDKIRDKQRYDDDDFKGKGK